jgi:hypothetical protein
MSFWFATVIPRGLANLCDVILNSWIQFWLLIAEIAEGSSNPPSLHFHYWRNKKRLKSVSCARKHVIGCWKVNLLQQGAWNSIIYFKHNYIWILLHSRMYLFIRSLFREPITVVARSKAWTLFARLYTVIVGSNPTWSLDVCVRIFCVYVVLCAGNGLATGFARLYTVIVGLNPTWSMDVRVRIFCVYVVLRAGNGLATGWYPIQGILPFVKKVKKLKKRLR